MAGEESKGLKSGLPSLVSDADADDGALTGKLDPESQRSLVLATANEGAAAQPQIAPPAAAPPPVPPPPKPTPRIRRVAVPPLPKAAIAKRGLPDLAGDEPHAALEPTARYTNEAARAAPGPVALPEDHSAHLEFLMGPGPGPSHTITRLRTVIGRGPTCEIRIDDHKSSREHAIITYDGREFRVRDNASANGTFLNGSKVVEYALRDGDKLLVGDTLFRFCLTVHRT